VHIAQYKNDPFMVGSTSGPVPRVVAFSTSGESAHVIKCADPLAPSGKTFKMSPFSGWVETALRDAIKRGNDTLHTQLHPASTNQSPSTFGVDSILWDLTLLRAVLDLRRDPEWIAEKLKKRI